MKRTKIILVTISAIAVMAIVYVFLIPHSYSSSKTYVLKKSAEIPVEKTTTLIAVGDIMLSRDVEQKMIRKNDWAYPFRETYQVTTTGDIVFGNLETPIIEGPTVPTNSMVFRADPESVAGLKFGGFNVLSLANNHMKNYGDEGIAKTIGYLDQADIAHTGAGLNTEEARQPAIIKVNGIKFGFLAYVDDSFTPNNYEATSDRPGSPFLNTATLLEDLENLNQKCDVIIVSMHAGTEYASTPNQKQIDFARTAIDYGAQLVLGHHPHVVQPIEQYKNGYIIYSLGNFVFDQMWSVPTRESFIASVIFKNNAIDSVELTPIKIFEFSQPRVLSDQQGQHIISSATNFTF